jgi:hypothetical protein
MGQPRALDDRRESSNPIELARSCFNLPVDSFAARNSPKKIFTPDADFSCIEIEFPYSAIKNSRDARGCEKAPGAEGGRDLN